MASRITYSEIDPRSEWVTTDDSDILLVHVSGFTKEQLKVQLDTSGKILVSGECVIDGDRWCRFLKEFKIPKKCQAKSIDAKFDEGTLYIILPKQVIANVHVPQDQQEENQYSTDHHSDHQKQYSNLSIGSTVLKSLWIHKHLTYSVIVGVLLIVGLGVYLMNRSTVPN
ncbi:hypothetical protein J5N97_016105 [Dioscorea zingiberensis]|uniref:SHSP domain-containing protein n=1 Tax=Dioscorea zingiberensis TaxID=325984 RepID=A0A9D5CL80_9LILI|nr:hypothetical protein J5N97_016105 [Dioscorea zingiberensis]